MRMPILFSALLATVLLGCSDGTHTRHYSISVKNDTGGPITVWLTKDGPPVEPGWRSPEQLAMVAPAAEERVGGLVVPPGKTADTGMIAGKFRPGAYAWLRIYEGQRLFSEILATSRDDPARIDLPLSPGKNDLLVKKTAGHLVVMPSLVAAPALPSAKP